MTEPRQLDLVDRLRGNYHLPVNDGAGPLNGSMTFSRQFETPPIQKEAAAEIENLRAIQKAAWDYFNHAVQDEADDRDNCIDDEQHRLACVLRDALDFPR